MSATAWRRQLDSTFVVTLDSDGRHLPLPASMPLASGRPVCGCRAARHERSLTLTDLGLAGPTPPLCLHKTTEMALSTGRGGQPLGLCWLAGALLLLSAGELADTWPRSTLQSLPSGFHVATAAAATAATYRPQSDPVLPPAAAAGAAALDCTGVVVHGDGAGAADFLGPLQFATVGSHRLAYRRVPARAAAPADATPLVLTPGYGEP